MVGGWVDNYKAYRIGRTCLVCFKYKEKCKYWQKNSGKCRKL